MLKIFGAYIFGLVTWTIAILTINLICKNIVLEYMNNPFSLPFVVYTFEFLMANRKNFRSKEE